MEEAVLALLGVLGSTLAPRAMLVAPLIPHCSPSKL